MEIIKLSKSELKDDCYAFYHVFVDLAEKCFFKYDQIFDDFDLFKENDKFFGACIVNGAFAAELALKYISYYRIDEYKKTHNLNSLLKELDTEDYNNIMLQLKKIEPDENILNALIDELSNNFIEWRYKFDFRKNLTVNVFFKDFVCVVCSYALSI